MDDVKKVFVYENWNENKPSLLGILYVEGGKGKQVVSFEYAEGWINNVANNVNLALSVAKLYDLAKSQAIEEVKEIKNIVENNWRKLAKQYGLSRSEIENMSPAFNMSYKE